MAIRVFHRDAPSLMLDLISKDARFVVWPGTGAWHANMNYVRLEPGEANMHHVHRTVSPCRFMWAAWCMSPLA
jgi:hypothetical protein